MSNSSQPHATHQARLYSTITWSLLKFTSTESVMLSHHLILCCPLLLLPSIFSSIKVIRIGTSVSASGLLMSIQGWFPLGLTVWSPCFPSDSQESSPQPQFESTNSLAFCLLYCPTLMPIHDYWKGHSLDYRDLFNLKFNMLSRFIITSAPRSNCLLISWPQSPFAVEPKKKKSATASIFSPSICHEVMEPDTMILVLFFVLFCF